MPFRSTAQQRFAFATSQPWAKRWAAETDFDTLPAHASRKRKGKKYGKRTKAVAVCTCKAERLAPGVSRIHGDLCNVHGRYGSCRAAGFGAAPASGMQLSRSQAPKKARASGGKRATAGGKKGGGKARAAARPKKPVKTPEERRAERETERQARQAENRQTVIDAMAQADAGLQPAAAKALISFADGKENPAFTDGLVKAGLMERGRDGTPRLTAAGRAAVAAMDRGDTRDALDAIGRGADRATAGTEREQAASERKRQAEERRKKAEERRKKGGGKRAQSKPPQPKQPTPEQQQREAERKRRQAAADQRRTEADARRQTAEQRRQANERQRGEQRQRVLTDLAQRMESGAKLSDTELQRLVVEGLAERDGAMIRMTAAGRRQARRKPETQKSFAIFKDARGQYRWITRTTTAYRDRDGEVLSTHALEKDAARMTATKQFGPLRFWHIGMPDPFDTQAPWGPGADWGDCDFSIVIGRTSVESGTFRSPEIAHFAAKHADEFEVSPGFFHSENDPDADGVFWDIRRFERSLVPMRFGRASNLFTGLAVQEKNMQHILIRYKTIDERTAARRLNALKAMGASDAIIQQTAAGVVQGEKTADEQRATFKSSDEAPIIYEAPDGTQGIIVGGRFVALKAMGGMDDGGEMSMDEVDTEDTGDEAEAVGDMTPDEFRALLREEFQAAIGEFGTGITTKMGEIDGMLKNMGYSRVKEAQADDQRAQEIARLKEQIAQQQTKLQELTDDQPANQQPPSSADGDVEAALKSSGPTQAQDAQANNGWSGIFERVATGGAAAAFQQWQAQQTPPQS